MRVTVRLFAGLRERAGFGERTLELDNGAVLGDVWAALDLGDEPNGLLYALNRAYATATDVLADGDEVALIPPVSGGAFRLSGEPLDPTAVVAEVADERAGAIATFLGTVRVESRGRTVLYLEYEAYEGMAEQVMEQIADELRAALRPLRDRHPPPHRPRRHRRGERCDRRVCAPSPRRPRRLQGRDRHAQGTRAALEEGGLRGRRGVDRPRFMSLPVVDVR